MRYLTPGGISHALQLFPLCIFFYSSYRKLKRKEFRAITISDLTQNLNHCSVSSTFHFNTHIVFSMLKNEPISPLSDPWLHLKGLQPSQYICCTDSVHYHKCMKWSHIFSITPFMEMPFQAQLLIVSPAVCFILQFKSQVSRAIKVVLYITV